MENRFSPVWTVVSTAGGTSNSVAALQPLRLTDGVVMEVLRYWDYYTQPNFHMGVLALLQCRFSLNNDVIKVTVDIIVFHSISLSLSLLNKWKCWDLSNNLLLSLARFVISAPFLVLNTYKWFNSVVMVLLVSFQGPCLQELLVGSEPSPRKDCCTRTTENSPVITLIFVQQLLDTVASIVQANKIHACFWF